jgi:hypothetical protein
MLRSRADVVPRVLDAFEGLLSSGRLDRLADGLDRLLAADLLPRVDRLLDHLADERVERALDLAGDDRVVRALELVTDERVDRTLDLLTGDRVQQALDLAADERVRTLLDLAADERVLRLLGRLDTLLAADRVPRLVDQAGALLDDERLSRVGTRLDRMLSDENLDRTEGLLGSGQPAAALGLLTRLDRELTDDAARALGTLLERLPALLSEERVAALAALTDQVPRLLGGLESGSLPRTADLGRVPTDLHAMLELIDDLHQVVSGLPGAGRARDRGDDPHPQVEDPRPPDDDAPNREAESLRTPTEGYS